MDAAMSNYHTKELDLRLGKFTFCQFKGEAKASEPLQDKSDFVVKVIG